MLLAQLHGKVPREFDGMEDVLTSSAFGLLKYLPEPLACRILSECAALPVEGGPFELDLWPRYPTPPGFASPNDTTGSEDELAARGNTEPDAQIVTGDWYILMEAKYRSPLDDAYDQLGREYAIGYRLARKRGLKFRLLVITAHTLEPKPGGVDLVTGLQRALQSAGLGLGEAASEMAQAVPGALHWTNWQRFYSIFSQYCNSADTPAHIRKLLADTCRLFELRSVRPYDTRSLVNVMGRWERSVIPGEAWLSPIAYRYRTIVSVAAGWEQLLRLDTSDLEPLAWRLRTAVGGYDLAEYLQPFELGDLGTLCWHPLP
jgi:hypothetical protein